MLVVFLHDCLVFVLLLLVVVMFSFVNTDKLLFEKASYVALVKRLVGKTFSNVIYFVPSRGLYLTQFNLTLTTARHWFP